MLSKLILIGLLLAPVYGQNTKSARRFAGSWEARFNGEVICTIRIQTGKQMSGGMHACRLNVNEEGYLVQSDQADLFDAPSPLHEMKIVGDTLSFVEHDEGEKPLKMSLRLLSEGEAELRFVDAPIQIKPIRFERKR